jgi:glutamate synthase domain-containing protein 3
MSGTASSLERPGRWTKTAAKEIDAARLGHRELNDRIRAAVAHGADSILLRNVRGQRYIGAGLGGGTEIVIEGVPGNDLACFMDGPRIVVRGNAQDAVANTMSSGEVVVHGHAGDVLGYGMRSGRLLIEGRAGYRIGIHMKEYRDRVPVIVVGGSARDYLGEYMAGGTLVCLGLGRREDEPVAGEFVGTGMHGGEIILLGGVEPWQLGREVGEVAIDEGSWSRLRRELDRFSREFGADLDRLSREDFTRLAPVSRRPYGRIYVY